MLNALKKERKFMRISLITNDPYLLRYAELKLYEKATLVNGFDESADVVLYDCESKLTIPKTSAKTVMLSRKNAENSVSIPLPINFFEELLITTLEKPLLTLSNDGKHAFVKDRRVKLTAHEFALLSIIVAGGENYTSREVIAKEVWGEASDGLINIYVHYLRDKLETDGEKIIVSSRKYGYRINPSYLGIAANNSSDSRAKGEEI